MIPPQYAPSLGGALALLLSALAPRAGAQSGLVHVPPNDPSFSYTEYVRVGLNPVRARFGRPTVDEFGSDMAPGARVNFTTDALGVRIGIDVRTGGLVTGRCALEIDGEWADVRLGSDSAGVMWATAFEQNTAAPHEFSLLMPYDAVVDFLGVELQGGALLPPPVRPDTRLVAYGDSITHGFISETIAFTWPVFLGRMQDWSVFNLGFGFRRVTPRDGLAIAELEPDVATVMIGANDYQLATPLAFFRGQYEGLLDALRLVQPSTDIWIVTPTWISSEDTPNALGWVLEDYREVIRDVVENRSDKDFRLLLYEGLDVIPPDRTNFSDGVHLSNSGAELMAQRLAAGNLVREGSFELGAVHWTRTGSAEADAAPGLGRYLKIGTGPGLARQRVFGLEPGETYRLEARNRVDTAGEHGAFGLVFYDDDGNWVGSQHLVTGGLTEAIDSLTTDMPVGAMRTEVWIWKANGPGTFFADEVRLVRE